MKVTQVQMDSRRRMLDLRSRFTEAVGKTMDEGPITYLEILTAMSEAMSYWSHQALKAERETIEGKVQP